MKKADDTTTIQELIDAFTAFRAERGWDKSATPRNLATSIAIEAAELLEHFQWGEDDGLGKQEQADELADILGYCVSFAHAIGIDISTAFFDKLERAKQKYPIELFHPGNHDDETYHRIKQSYRQHTRPKR